MRNSITPRPRGQASLASDQGQPSQNGHVLVGDRVQWTVSGQDQFTTPLKVLAIDQGPDGRLYAELEGQVARAPIDQCSVVAPLEPDAGVIRHALGILIGPGEFHEIRGVPSGRFQRVSGDALDEATRVVLSMGSDNGIYCTLNPIRSDLGHQAARDKHVIRRKHLLIDVDAAKLNGANCMATAAEKAAAIELAIKIRDWLCGIGWTCLLIIDSGNGGHLICLVDLANDDENKQLTKRFLKALAAAFNVSGGPSVDAAVYNAGRITKIPGTIVRKGPHSEERPHRVSGILEVPAVTGEVITGEMIRGATEVLEALAATHQPAPTVFNGQPSSGAFGSTVRDGSNPEARARAYLFSAGFPDSVEGQRGHGTLFRVACELVDGFGLTRGQALPILREWNQSKAKPPESDRQIQHKLDGAIEKHPTPLLGRLEANGPRLSRVTRYEDGDETPIFIQEWPAPPSPDAYYGLAGDIVRAITPHTEADPAALFFQSMIMFGSMAGHAPYVRVGGEFHHAHENVLVIGPTGSGRKGQSLAEVHSVFGEVDSAWRSHCVASGLSSSEGLIYAVRDEIVGRVPIKEKGRIVDYQEAILDPGVADKRLLVTETEFGGVLKRASREGNSLSATLREAWDKSHLRTLTKGSPYKATGAHISLISHITHQELSTLLTEVDVANGFINRFLLCCARRAKLLPFGGRVPQDELDRLRERLSNALAFAQGIAEVKWTRRAMSLWESAYPRLTAPRLGAMGKATSRAEPHTLRLALIHALMNQSSKLEPDHIEAALASWDYCERSAVYLFGNSTGDREADRILTALRETPSGMTRSEIRREVFGDHKPAGYVASKLTLLVQLGVARSEMIPTAGRTAERWFGGGRGYPPCVTSVISPEDSSLTPIATTSCVDSQIGHPDCVESVESRPQESDPSHASHAFHAYHAYHAPCTAENADVQAPGSTIDANHADSADPIGLRDFLVQPVEPFYVDHSGQASKDRPAPDPTNEASHQTVVGASKPFPDFRDLDVNPF